MIDVLVWLHGQGAPKLQHLSGAPGGCTGGCTYGHNNYCDGNCELLRAAALGCRLPYKPDAILDTEINNSQRLHQSRRDSTAMDGARAKEYIGIIL